MKSLLADCYQKEYTVSELSYELKKTLEKNFDSVSVKGEISGLKIATSGHAYFNLKDQGAILACTCWRPILSTLQMPIEDGMEIVVTGKITTYLGQSKYQLNVVSIRHSGVGTLMKILEERKKKFLEEGLFAAEHKISIPLFPKIIGVITSLSGAVIRDIIHRIQARYPIVHLIIWPVSVQGTSSAQEVTDAINGFNASNYAHKPDVIIVARGGGSIEDLWSFNEEIVVRAAFDSKIPIISAIGHETDFTLLDLVADLRAPTPTAAAEMSVPVVSELMINLRNHHVTLQNKLEYKMRHAIGMLESYNNTIIFNPNNFLYYQYQKVDVLSIKLHSSMPHVLQTQRSRLLQFNNDVNLTNKKIELLEYQIQAINLNASYRNFYHRVNTTIHLLANALYALDVNKILQRGFVIIRSDTDVIIHNAASLPSSANIKICFVDGTRNACVE